MEKPSTVNGITALELTMRDVLAGMEELATEAAFGASGDGFEILSIEPAGPPRPEYPPQAVRPRPALVPVGTRRRVA